MNTTQDDGGPAFPTQTYDDYAARNGIGVTVTDKPGMSLRDWFAGMALQGQIASMSTAAAVAAIRGEDAPGWCAESAYKFADAMLAARKEAR